MSMSRRYCFLCASDEGVFLDITEENRAAICQQLEICSLHPELSESADESLKQICHKCAYELKQCSSFVNKFKKTLNTKKTSKLSNKVCSLCLDSGNKLQLFDLEEDNYSEETPIYKIRSFFNHDIYENENRLICLSCRYILDVLYDLKKIYKDTLPRLQNIKNEDLNYSLFPKTRTRVVNRKTTITENNFIPDISVSSSGSESNIMPRKKESKTNVHNRKSLLRSDAQSCTECKNTYNKSTDVYRIHKTGDTICKKCWLTVDPGGPNNTNASIKTKVCSVFVKDVLQDSTYKRDHVYKVEEDSDGKKTYIVTKLQDKEKTLPTQRKGKRTGSLDESRKPQKRSKVYSTRGAKTSAESTDTDEKTNKKPLKPSKNGNISKISSDDEPVTMRRTRNQVKNEAKNAQLKRPIKKQVNQRNLVKEPLRKAASDTEQVKSVRKLGRPRKRPKASKTDPSEESSSEGVSSKKRRKLVAPKTEKNGEDIVDKASAADSSNSDIEIISVTDASDETNDVELKTEEFILDAEAEDDLPKSRREKRTQASEPLVVMVNEKSKSKTNLKKDVKSKRQRSTSASSNEMPQTSVGRKKHRENTPPSQEPETLDISESSNGEEVITLEEDKPYICNICEKSYETRLLGLSHELTHHRQLEVKLHRRELAEETEAKHDAGDKAARLESEEVSESIAIRLDDDEDTELDATSKPEKEDAAHSDEVKEEISPKENKSLEASNVTDDVKEERNQHDASPQKTDVVQCSSVEVDKDKTPEVLDDSLLKDLGADDVTKDSSNTNNTAENKQKDSNKEAEVHEKSVEKSDNSVEKADQVDSTETDTLSQTDVKTNEADVVDKDVSVMKESDDAPTETVCEDIKENGDITEKVKENEVEQEELSSSMDTATKNTDNTESNTEEVKDVPQKETEACTDQAHDTVKTVKENNVDEAGVLEKKDGCEDTNVTTDSAVDSPLQDLEGSKSEGTGIDMQENQSAKAATEVLQEVFDLAAAEVQKRHDSSPNSEAEQQEDVETLENISREIQNSVDLKPLNTDEKNETAGNEVSLD